MKRLLMAMSPAFLLLALAWFAQAGIEDSPFFGDFEFKPVSYYDIPADDRVARLQAEMDAGRVVLKHEEEHGYLKSVLEHLRVDRRSQMLVFSKTSFQLRKISPHQPRAVYFNDDTYIGWVQNGEVIELASADPRRGTIFYTLKQDPEGSPKFLRDNSCLQCHADRRTLGVPGPLVRSVFPDINGFPIVPAGGFVTNHSSPMEQRWGGWYVTGLHGRQRHMGNVHVKDAQNKPDALDVERGANVTDLSGFFPVTNYLTPHSDLVALMVLEHQAYMQNLLTRADFEVRTLLYREADIRKRLGEGEQAVSPATRQRIEQAAISILRYMLMVNEICLDDPVSGSGGFTQAFSSQGPKDSRGRSLRDLDLKRFLFRYPCSYMIYSPAFDGLNDELKSTVYRKLYAVLTGEDRSGTWNSLSDYKRQAVLQILRETKRDLPPYFHENPRHSRESVSESTR